MIGNSLQLVVKRTLAHWRLLSAVVVGVVLASTIMASSVIFFDALRDVALQRALSTHNASDIDVLVEAGQVPTNQETHAQVVEAMDGSIVRKFNPFLDQREFALKTWTFFVDLPPPALIALVYGAITYLFVRLFAYLALCSTHTFVKWGVWGGGGALHPDADKLDVMWTKPAFDSLFGPFNWEAMNGPQQIGAFLIGIWVFLAAGLFNTRRVLFGRVRSRRG